MREAELIALLRLQRLPRVNSILAKKLLHYFGSAQAIFNAKKSDLLRIPGCEHRFLSVWDDRKYLEQAKTELAFMRNRGIHLSSFLEEDYPALLKQSVDGPLVLFRKGKINFKNRRFLSIVGARRASLRGIHFVTELIANLAPWNPVIVSGFSYGISIAAHQAALMHNLQTIGCLAHGLDRIYPKAFASYRSKIEENGGFVSDFWRESKNYRTDYLRRNCIIAGLSEATLVVESEEKSGALVTADMAFSYDREVFSVPGRPGDRMSVGCNHLIKSQKAQAVTCAADILYFLNWEAKDKKDKI